MAPARRRVRSAPAARGQRANPGDEPDRVAVDVELGADPVPGGHAEPAPQVRVLGQAAERRGDRGRVARRHGEPGDTVDDELGDPRQGAGHDRQAGAHRLHQHDRDPLALAPAGRDARGDEDVARRQQPDDLVARPLTQELDPVGQARLGDLALERGPIRPVPDEAAAEGDAVGGQPPAGLDEVGLALDLVERADREDRQGPAGSAGRGTGWKTAVSTPQWMHLEGLDRAAALALEDRPVVLRDRHRERRLGDLLAEHRPVDVEVRAVGGERVRDADQPMDEKPASAGWVAKWQWTWRTPSRSISRAAWATLGKMPIPPSRKFGLRQVPPSTSPSVPR